MKIRKFHTIEMELGKYHNPSSQKYDLLLKRLPENDKVSEIQYLLETIIMH